MKNIRYLIYSLSLSALCVVTSCKKLVDVPPPTNTLVTTSVFNSNATVIAAQLAVYANLESSFYNFEATTGLSADELTNYSTSQSQIDIYLNNVNPQTDQNLGLWTTLYNYIYQENAILSGVQSTGGTSASVKKLAMGEAYFMRAWCYFQLVNLYGDVPLVVTTDHTQNSTLARTPVKQVYQQLISDLQAAQGLLSSSYLDASDNTGATDRVRPTTWAADALLARAYLYYGNLTGDVSSYVNATKQAGAVIANTSMFSLVSDLNAVFLMNSSEAIWQLTPASGTLYTEEGADFILTSSPAVAGSSSINSTTISPQLLNAFESNDLRKTDWIGSYTEGGTIYYFPYKYKSDRTSGALTEYSMVFRLAELYLILAEADARQNDLSDASANLNIIRERAGLPPTTATSQADLLTAISHERQVELFTEEHRWLDLKRTKTVDAVMGTVTPQKGGIWNSYQQLYPLSITDLQYDLNLKQNAGY